MRPWIVCCCVLWVACGAQRGSRTSDVLFASPEAELARDLAPDLVVRAEAALARADEARDRKNEAAAEDYETEARLWLSAAVVEAARIQLRRRRDELEREGERWAKQLARDQEAAAIVATDITRYRAKAVALREAERIRALGESPTTDDETLDAVLTRVRINLALAEALGASKPELGSLRARADAVARRRPESARAVEALLLDSEALVGQMRAQWPTPQPGASTELVQTAWVTGFSADRTGSGTVVRSERFFNAGGGVSEATIKRFEGLLAAFPHGPVACQVAVPEAQSRIWSPRVARLIDRLRRIDDPDRVSTSMIATKLLPTGAVQCTFAAYSEP